MIALWCVMLFMQGCASLKENKNIDESSPAYVYPEWRKTVMSFGKRKRFAILRGTEFDEQEKIIGSNRWILYDQQENKAIDEEIIHKHNNVPPYVYTFGKNGYTRLNYETGEFTQNKDISIFSEEDKKILEKLVSKEYD